MELVFDKLAFISESNFPLQYAKTMVKVLGKLALIDISIWVFDEAFAMFLGVLQLALIIISRNKVVLSLAIQLVIDPTSWVLIPVLPGVLSFSMFGFILI